MSQDLRHYYIENGGLLRLEGISKGYLDLNPDSARMLAELLLCYADGKLYRQQQPPAPKPPAEVHYLKVVEGNAPFPSPTEGNDG